MISFLFTTFIALISLAIAKDSCFLGYPVGHEFEYQFHTELTMSKTETNAEAVGIHTGNHDIDMRLTCVITNHGADANGAFHFELNIIDGSVTNPDDWQRFGTDGVDEKMLKEHFLKSMKKPFYYEQNCDMSIDHVYFDDSEDPSVLNTKKNLVKAFAAQLTDNELNYTQKERDHLGVHEVDYEHQQLDDGLKVISSHSAHRLVPVVHRALRRTHERVGSQKQRETVYKNGIVHSVNEQSATRWPADDAVNERAPSDWAAEANHGNTLVVKTSSKLIGMFVESRELPAERRRQAPSEFDSTEAFFKAAHGPAASFERAPRHTMHDAAERRTAAPMSDTQGLAFMRQSVQYLSKFDDVSNRDAETGTRLDDPTPLLLDLWRAKQSAHGEQNVVKYICNALHRDDQCRSLAHESKGAASNFDEAFERDAFDDEAPADVPAIGAVAEAAAYNALAMLACDSAQQAVLTMSLDKHSSWTLRNRALMALPLFKIPTQQSIDVVRKMYLNDDENDHVRKQALLTYGALIYNHETAADAAVVDAQLHALDDADAALVAARRAQSDAHQRCEELRKALHDEFLEAPDTREVGLGRVDVHTYAMALHNSLKDIAPHAWMDPATILRARRIPLVDLVPANDAELRAAAAAMDAAHVSTVHALAACHADDGACDALRSTAADVETDPAMDRVYAAMAKHNDRVRAHEHNIAPTDRKRQADPEDEARVVAKSDPAVQGLAIKPGNFEAFGTPMGRQNVRVSQVIKDFFKQHKCTPWGACSAFSYRNKRPVGEPEEGNRSLWNNTIGSDKFYAYLEALTDFRAAPVSREDLGASYQFFAGALVSANIFDAEIPLLQAYAAGGFQHRTRAGELGVNCTSFELELYFDYLLNAYYLKASDEKNCTTGIESTCKANYPPEEEVTFHAIDAVEFFKFEFRINEAWLNALFTIRGLGSVGFNINWGFYISEIKGGLALNGLVEPLGKVDVVATVTSPVIQYDGLDVLQLEIEGTLNLIQLSLPAIGGLNAQTYRGCASLSVLTKALGGKILLKLKVFYMGDADVEIFRWKGARFELPIFKTSCCKECLESCYNAFCNYRFGECECLIGYDGPGCDIECPADCAWPGEPHPGAVCIPGGPRRSTCYCNIGSYGWNCMSECPGGRFTPCSGHGTCDAEGLCTCDLDYYGADCSQTCPLVDGEICGAHGRCVYDGENAKCQCFANAVGPKCELKCPESLDERKAPCSRRGDCWQDPIDNDPRCLCRLGFHGARCEKLDANGSGRMLELTTPLELGIRFKRNQTDAERFAELKPDGASFAGVWFQPTQLPATTASLVEWRFGRVDITKNGDVRVCSGKDSDCYTSPLKAKKDDWQYISATIYHHSNEVLIRHWTRSDNMVGKQQLKTALKTKPFPEINMNDDVVRVARKFVGKLDQLALMHLDSTAMRAQPTFDDAEVIALRDEVIATHHAALRFYVLFDLGRGDHVFDQISMLRGELPDRCPISENRAPSTCRKERFEFSDIRVKHATVSSPPAPPIKLNNAMQKGDYSIQLDGRRIIDAAVDIVVDSKGPPCTIDLLIGTTQVASTSGPIVGQAATSLALSAQGLTLLDNGANELTWRGTANCVLAESTLSVRVAAVDPAVEFGGSPYSFARLPHAALPLAGSWQLEMWVRRDPVLVTQAGVLLGMVSPAYEPKEALSASNSDFLLYETGGSDQGVRIGYRAGGRHLFENYATPIAEWFHLSLGVQHAGSECTLNFHINGKSLTTDASTGRLHPAAKHACGNGAVRGFGGNAYELRLGMAFGGEMNDLLFWKTPQANPRTNMHMFKNIAALKPKLLAAYTFDSTDESDPTKVVDETGTQAPGVLNNGAFRSLIYGVYHKWKLCPGITYFSTETVCSTRTYWEQGVCVRRPGVDNYQCECNDGFFGSDCSGECPGGAGNICSNHGVCQILNETVCVCDQGYVGTACEHECPGWTDPLNQPNRKICFGFGTCRLRDDGQGAECLCDQEFDRYGPSCQYSYGEDPVASIDEACENCRGAHKRCVEGECLCEEGYYLVVGVCKKNSALAMSPSFGLLAALFTLLAVNLL